jgi:uncharacterized protein (TIGR02453 family)
MGFSGWPEDALDFYEGLEADNSKAYWQQHKSVYEECVLGPMQALLGELEKGFGEGKIFRPYRDIRFSADKSPYKTAMGATLAKGGYVQISSQGLGAGSGYYVMASDQLDRYRKAVDNNSTGAKLEKIVADARKAKLEITGHDTLKSAPRGYEKDHPRIELLRCKGLIAWKQWPAAAWLGTAKAKDRLVEFFGAAKPLTKWLDANVGPTTMPQDRR